MEGSKVSSLGLVDTTLRDGEQTAGIAFSVKEKIEIARKLDQMGIQVIEAGTPIMGVLEQKAISGILESGLSCQVVTWNRILEKDVAASIQCGATFVHLSAPVSDLMIFYKLGKDRKWIIEQLRRTIYYAANVLNLRCTIDTGVSNSNLVEVCRLVAKATTDN